MFSRRQARQTSSSPTDWREAGPRFRLPQLLRLRSPTKSSPLPQIAFSFPLLDTGKHLQTTRHVAVVTQSLLCHRPSTLAGISFTPIYLLIAGCNRPAANTHINSGLDRFEALSRHLILDTQAVNNGGSSTCVVELQDQTCLPTKPVSIKSQRPESIRSVRSLTLSQIPDDSSKNDDPVDTLPSPTTATEKLQEWNNPRVNTYRTFSAFWSFFIMGANDAAYGALLPYLEEYYDLTYTIVSLVFLSPLIGYCASALLNNTVHLKFGQRGVAFLGPLCHLIAYAVMVAHPPYPVLVIVFAIAGFGNGLEDAGWNAWMGSMANANEVLGFLHAFYSFGATISPLVATSMITKANLQWFEFYYVMVGCSALELAFCLITFWGATAAVFRAQNPKTPGSAQSSRMREALAKRPAARVTWLCAFFLLVYVGVEVALGGWIVTFMLRVRGGAAFASGMTATGFWLGMAVGRIVLGFVTPRIGEKLAIAIYLPICAVLELLFWLVPSFLLSAIAVAFQGFFLGPMFPGAVVAATKLLPKHLHVSAIGFAAAFGGGGAAVFPFAVGAIAQARGVQVLQPFVLALIVGCWICWMGLPRMGRKRE